jgi:hypothetical protein
MKWVRAWRRGASGSNPTVREQAAAKWEADRRDDADLDAVELYLPVASPVVFRGLDQRVVVTRALAWLRRHADDFRIVGMTWWTDEARDPRAGREGDHLFRHTLTVHVTMGCPSDEVDWGRG